MWGAFWRWRRAFDDHEVLVKELNFDQWGTPINGVIEITRAGKTYRFKFVGD